MSNPSSQSGENKPGDAAYWAVPVAGLKVSGLPEEAINLNVEGRQLTGPLRGFGPMWQKIYKVRLSGAAASPVEVIQTWKKTFLNTGRPGTIFMGR